MRTLLVALLLVASPLALAEHNSTYAPAWDRHSPRAWGTRDLAGQARVLDHAATRLYYDIRSRAGHSELTSRARELAESTRDFRRLAERRASYAQLRSAHQRVAYRYAALERRLDNRGREYRHRYALAALNQVEHALRRVGSSLQRYAYDRYDDRRWDRYDHDWRGDRLRNGYVLNPRDPWRGRVDSHARDSRHDPRHDPRHDLRHDRQNDRQHDQRRARQDDRIKRHARAGDHGRRHGDDDARGKREGDEGNNDDRREDRDD